MKGDFSQLRFDPHENISALLHQQGRVLNDADLSEAALIQLDWDDRAARDIIGRDVAAVPADEHEGFKVLKAASSTAGIGVLLHTGRIWADGIHAFLADDAKDATERGALFYGPKPAAFGAGDRDTIFLEIWRDTLSSFQQPKRLLEPALGGPDTVTRAQTSYALRAMRLLKDEDCMAARSRLPKPSDRLLTVSLEKDAPSTGECPTIAEGGYSGFEHNLYRIEIAPDAGVMPSRFKWSQFNGGLVARASCNVAKKELTLEANRDAVITSGLTSCYIDVVQWDEALGIWKITYSSEATLQPAGVVVVTNPPTFAIPAGETDVFIRIWNGIEDIAKFTGADKPLKDGIRLHFKAAGTLRSGDYWSFSVRADLRNDETLIDQQPPAGPVYHVVPLAEIMWQAAGAAPILEDCRRRFRPLTNLKCCCTWNVGNGVTSFGDFNSLEEAIEHLPPYGGKICLMPGIHFANLALKNRHDIVIEGCLWQTLLLPHKSQADKPIISLTDCQRILIEGIDFAGLMGTTLLLEGTVPLREKSAAQPGLEDIRIIGNRFTGHVHALHATGAQSLRVTRNQFYQWDYKGGSSLVSIQARDSEVLDNEIRVFPHHLVPTRPGNEPHPPSPADDCADKAKLLEDPHYLALTVYFIWTHGFVAMPQKMEDQFIALGGLHLRAGSDNVLVRDNTMQGGAGNGITLGGILPGDEVAAPAPHVVSTVREVLFKTDNNTSAVTQLGDGTMIPNIKIQITDSLNAVHVKVSDATGTFTLSGGIKGGNMSAISLTPGFVLVKVTFRTVPGIGFQNSFMLEKVVVPPTSKPATVRGFLHHITIESNEIKDMGRNGIASGVIPAEVLKAKFNPPSFPGSTANEDDFKKLVSQWFLELVDYILALMSPLELLQGTSKLLDLTIRQNHIHGNLLHQLDDEGRKLVRRHGQGGISLGVVDTAAIDGNTIENNGPHSQDPACGIYIGWGDNVDIRDNAISNNGKHEDDDLLEGIRGGIYVRFASSLSPQLSKTTTANAALRVHENRVDQPIGPALVAFSFGTLSVFNNHLNSESTGKNQFWDKVAGAVQLIDLGGLHRLLFKKVISSLKHSSDPDAQKMLAALTIPGLPSGETQVSDNRVRLGIKHESVTAQLIISLDDLGFADNQSTIHHPNPIAANTVLLAPTIRATASRFCEDTLPFFQKDTRAVVVPAPIFSLLSVAMSMNCTAFNQGDHCIISSPSGPGTQPNDLNQTLADDCTGLESQNAVTLLLKIMAQAMQHTAIMQTTYTAQPLYAQGTYSQHMVLSMHQTQQNVAMHEQQEYQALQQDLPAGHPLLLTYSARMAGRQQILEATAAQCEAFGISPPPAPVPFAKETDQGANLVATGGRRIATKPTPLSKLGVSAAKQKKLTAIGVTNVESLVNISPTKLQAILGDETKSILVAAKKLLANASNNA
jgi:hypothetical protein